MGEYYVRDLRGTLYLLFGAVALLLAIGCGNVSILLLARARRGSMNWRSVLRWEPAASALCGNC